MKLLKRDILATALVAIAGVLYGLWAIDSAPWGISTRVTRVVVLVLAQRDISRRSEHARNLPAATAELIPGGLQD